MKSFAKGKIGKAQRLAALKSKLQEKGMRVLKGRKEDKVHNRQFAGGKGA